MKRLSKMISSIFKLQLLCFLLLIIASLIACGSDGDSAGGGDTPVVNNGNPTNNINNSNNTNNTNNSTGLNNVTISGSEILSDSSSVVSCDGSTVGKLFIISSSQQLLVCTGAYYELIDPLALENQGISTINWLGPLASAPVTPAVSDAYFNTSESRAYVYTGNRSGAGWTALPTLYQGMRAITTAADLPICDSVIEGHVFYVIDVDEFQYCDGTNYATIDVSEEKFTISVTTTGLSGGTLVLKNNEVDELSIAADGTSSFSTTLSKALSYKVKVASHPAGQVCYFVENSESKAFAAGYLSGNITLTVNCESSMAEATYEKFSIDNYDGDYYDERPENNAYVKVTLDATGLSTVQDGSLFVFNVYDSNSIAFAKIFGAFDSSKKYTDYLIYSIDWQIDTSTNILLKPGVYRGYLAIDDDADFIYENGEATQLVTFVVYEGATNITLKITDSNTEPGILNGFEVSGFTTVQVPDNSSLFCNYLDPIGRDYTDITQRYPENVVGFNHFQSMFASGAMTAPATLPFPMKPGTYDLVCIIDGNSNNQLDDGEYYYYIENFVPSAVTISLTQTDFQLFSN